MNIQLLLLLALVGPFCAFTQASPTALTTDSYVGTTDTFTDFTDDATVGPKDLDVVTGPPSTEPAVAADEVVTDTVTEAAPTSFVVITEEPVLETEAPTPAATTVPQPPFTDPPAVETAAPSDPAEVHPHVTVADETTKGGQVVVEDDVVEGLSSGQVVGIVIGAILAVVIAIAVVIAVARRMGKYSSSKSKKTVKKPLKKTPAKQQERSKFWKF